MSQYNTNSPTIINPPTKPYLNTARPQKVLPTMSATGWVQEPYEKLDYLMCHFFLADAGMSYLNPIRTYNLQDIFGQASTDPSAFVSRLEEALTAYLRAYYSEAEVNVINTSEEKGDQSINVTVTAQIYVMDNGETVDFEKVINYRNGKFAVVLNKNNFGFI